MVKVCEDDFPDRVQGTKSAGYYMDGILKANLDILYKAVTKDDWDGILLVDGYEGAGKSVLAQQIGYYLARGVEQKIEFDVDNICFTSDDFKNKVVGSKKHNIILWDEARRGINVRRSMSSINSAITDMLAEIRQKNLFIIIVMPTFMDMDKNVAVWRAKCLIHVYTKGFQRGFFRFYNRDKKRVLYFLGKKQYYNYNVVKSDFYGGFKNFYTLNEKAYRKKKEHALQKYQTTDILKEKGLICPECNSKFCRYNCSQKMMVCRKCGHVWKKKEKK